MKNPMLSGGGIPDPFGSMENMLNQFQNFMGNPMQFMAQNRLNLPQSINPLQDPNGAMQHFLNNGKLNQQQYNQLQHMGKEIQQNPRFMQLFGNIRNKR